MLFSGAAWRARTRIVVTLLGAIAAAGSTLAARDGIDVTVAARAVQPGEVVRVDVSCACDTAPRAVAFGLTVPLTRIADGPRYQGFFGIDLDTPPGPYPLLVDMPGRWPAVSRTVLLTVEAKRFATRTLRVAPEYVEPPASVTDRIVKEAAQTDQLFKTVTPRGWNSPFTLPIGARPTSNFGSRSIYNGVPRSPHAGVDFSSPTGTPVIAPSGGRVAVAHDLYFTGNTVIIDHGAGLYSLFAHLSSIAVGPGDVVAQGAVVGRVGATGRATGPHLHWSVRLNGARVDPLSLLIATREPPRHASPDFH